MFYTHQIISILNWATKPVAVTEEYRAAQEKSMVYWEKIGKIFPTQFINELDELEYRKCSLDNAEHFERGFWLGLRLGQFAEQGPRSGVRNP